MNVVGMNYEEIEVLVTGLVLDDRGYAQGVLDRFDLDRHHFRYDRSWSRFRYMFRCRSRCFFSYDYRFGYSLRNHRFNHLLHRLRRRSGNRSRNRFFFSYNYRFRYSLRNHRFNRLLDGLGCRNRHRSCNRFLDRDYRFINRYRSRGCCTSRQSKE